MENSLGLLLSEGKANGGNVHVALGKTAVRVACVEEILTKPRMAVEQGMNGVSAWGKWGSAVSRRGRQAAITGARMHSVLRNPGGGEFEQALSTWPGDRPGDVDSLSQGNQSRQTGGAVARQNEAGAQPLWRVPCTVPDPDTAQQIASNIYSFNNIWLSRRMRPERDRFLAHLTRKEHAEGALRSTGGVCHCFVWTRCQNVLN